jgi:hypothetical protein
MSIIEELEHLVKVDVGEVYELLKERDRISTKITYKVNFLIGKFKMIRDEENLSKEEISAIDVCERYIKTLMKKAKDKGL